MNPYVLIAILSGGFFVAFGGGFYYGHRAGLLDGSVASVKAMDRSAGLVRDVECVCVCPEERRPVRTINEPAPYVPKPESWE